VTSKDSQGSEHDGEEGNRLVDRVHLKPFVLCVTLRHKGSIDGNRSDVNRFPRIFFYIAFSGLTRRAKTSALVMYSSANRRRS
jgi:hypothetical protein